MRGKADDLGEEIAADRITPAYAGKSSHFVRRIISPWDHPRLCGEKVKVTSSEIVQPGSPPPMRGKDSSPRVVVARVRITPAYAGKSCCRISFFLRIGDHPRLCGEKSVAGLLVVALAGSPPPMRGKVYLLIFLFLCFGITPAYAGKRCRKKAC